MTKFDEFGLPEPTKYPQMPEVIKMNERIKAITGRVLDEIVPETWTTLGYDKIKQIQYRTAELLLLDVMELQCLSEWERQSVCSAYGLEYKPIMMNHPSYGDLFQLDEWDEYVKCGAFNSDDGSGYWATKTQYAHISCWDQMPDWATHILWFNK